MNKESAKERILETGAALVHAKGFNNTGLQEILEACNVPKGSFYFYFKNKEDFGVQLVDHHLRCFAQGAGALLRDRGLPPLERLRAFLEWFAGYFRDMGYTQGCPLGNLIQEMSDLSPAFREKLAAAMQGLGAAIGALIAEAQGRGECAPDLDPEAASRFILAGWQGALMHMKLHRSQEPLNVFVAMLFGRVLRP